MARRVAEATRGDAAVAHNVDAGADRRTVLAARLARAGLPGAGVRGVPGRRLDGRVRRRRLPDAGALLERRLDPDPRRELGALLPRRRLPGPQPRLAPRAGALLRSLPQGRPERLGARP